MAPSAENPITRKRFLQGAAAVGIAAGAAAAAPGSLLTPRARAKKAPRAGLNILVVMVDQMRAPYVFMPRQLQTTYVPNITKLGDQGVRFSRYYTVSNDCTPARAAQVTGLYTHQIGIFGTTETATLNAGFPTFGSMLRENGYETNWFGKWHVTPTGDPRGATCLMADPYEAYGFTANWPGKGTCPSPDGGANQGIPFDPMTTSQFTTWLASRQNTGTPWFSMLSLINPHDIQFFPNARPSDPAPSVYSRLPVNYETNDERRARMKPDMQYGSVDVHNKTFGYMPDNTRDPALWAEMNNVYLQQNQYVDAQIGVALNALAASPFADNTMVIFTSDHGEYGGAHGMRGKGFSFYEEGARVPLIVRDPTGTWTKATKGVRRQMFSSVDLAALLLTVGTGGEKWRADAKYKQIAGRASIARVLANPMAEGRPYIAHATDEEAVVPAQIGGADGQIPYDAPNHITAVRTDKGKIVRYAYWKPGTYNIDTSKRIDWEAYDYSTSAGRLELDNVYNKKSHAGFVRHLKALLQHANKHEIKKPLPSSLQATQDAAMTAWFGQTQTTPFSYAAL